MSQPAEIQKKVEEQTSSLLPTLIKIRRQIHENPELSFEEFETSKLIEKQLLSFGIADYKILAKTGVVALIKGKNPRKGCVALRADMDALPITELNKTAYRSKKEGVMHACGHDVHTACLLGTAKVLNNLKDTFEGTIKLIFQPGEEKSPGGASLMIKAGALKTPVPKAIFGLHVDPALPAGSVGFRPGQYMASADEIHIRVIGKGGHAALPQLAIDPIPIAALIITALQQVVSRKANPITPSVLTFGKIEGGHATNVIPDEVVLAGTFRTFDEQWRAEAKEIIKKTAENIAASFGAKAEVLMPPGYPSVYNAPELTGEAIKFAEGYLGKDKVARLALRMTAEDFAHYQQELDGCFFRLGTNLDNRKFLASVHNPNFDVHEPALILGTKMMSMLAMNYLSHLNPKG